MHRLMKYVIVGLALNSITSIASAETRAALLIIDVQDCFLPGGSLPVNHGEVILPVINSIVKNNTFDVVVFSLDWHPAGHVSFASAHNRSAFETVTLRYLENGTLCVGDTVTSRAFPDAVNCGDSTTKALQQVVYPDHCIQNVTTGPTSSLISRDLVRDKDDLNVYKGTMKQIDSYSAFFDNGKFFSTNLDDELKRRQINTVFVVGFALDICVFHTSMDAIDLGYTTYVVTDASLGIDPQQVVSAKEKLTGKGVKLIMHDEIQAVLKDNGCLDTPSLGMTVTLVLLLTSLQFTLC
ncbi:hypothetical protein BsWGS_24861 [Bradybaena similaris]